MSASTAQDMLAALARRLHEEAFLIIEGLPRESLVALIATDPKALQHYLQTEVGARTQVAEQLAIMAVVSRLQLVSGMVPVFRHHCPKCEYHGRMERQHGDDMNEGEPSQWVDLYTCQSHDRDRCTMVVVRYHDNLAAYYVAQRDATDPHVLEARRRFE